ncbi:hypothetical protein ZEAMMB73_Zm00001d048034 [Zea mays]|uniref:Uncharacterized protein n=1 Tax=Zea mays TaxID=4577 RepID=A0A1D6PG36_MAIZE|nr:hypothetical protein ZEAMMB73_Zm00001d048034 [Zea mays]
MEGLLPNPADGRWRMEVARTFHPRGAHLHPPRPPADLQSSTAHVLRAWGGGARPPSTLSYPSGPRSSLTFHRRRRIDLGNLCPPTRTTDSTTAPYNSPHCCRFNHCSPTSAPSIGLVGAR